jgi:hypothetical protein
MHPERFEHHTALQNYAERNGLTFVWEGMAAFANRARTLSPDEFAICTVRTKRGTTRALLFAKAMLQAEFEADRPFREAMAIERAGGETGGCEARGHRAGQANRHNVPVRPGWGTQHSFSAFFSVA